ncbi:hypothetical protein [Amycolatopsis sp. NPDC003731]
MEALALVETDVPLVSVVRVGAEVAVVRELWERLQQAVREYDQAPRSRRMTIALSDVELHVVHTALVLAPRIVTSEEAFHIRTGAFKEQMSSLADGLIAGPACTPPRSDSHGHGVRCEEHDRLATPGT